MTPLLILLIVLALALLYKNVSPFNNELVPHNMYAWSPGVPRPIPVDPPTPGLDWRLHPSIRFMGSQ